jgi:hypothetical protein
MRRGRPAWAPRRSRLSRPQVHSMAHAPTRAGANRHRWSRQSADRKWRNLRNSSGRRRSNSTNTRHWHGATPSNAITQIAIQKSLNGPRYSSWKRLQISNTTVRERERSDVNGVAWWWPRFFEETGGWHATSNCLIRARPRRRGAYPRLRQRDRRGTQLESIVRCSPFKFMHTHAQKRGCPVGAWNEKAPREDHWAFL